MYANYVRKKLVCFLSQHTFEISHRYVILPVTLHSELHGTGLTNVWRCSFTPYILFFFYP